MFCVSPEEKKLIRRKMIEAKTKNMGAYLRKMAIDGYIVNTDTTPLKKQYEEMHKIGVNINQIAKKVNSTGELYPEEMQELKEMVKELWRILRSSPLK
ncbi:MobC family plasmid mobilization relaxosome protein [Anaerobutyricum hallii]|nr:MobC family plasmid mobilization relaxosome protein [Anaerobutyricum hallii]